MGAPSTKSKVMSVRVSNALQQRIEKAYAQYKGPLGVKITKSAFVTHAVEVGLNEIMQRLELER